MGVAAQSEIFLGGSRSTAVPRRRSKCSALAAPFVSFEDGTAERRGDVSTAPARVLGRHLRLPGLGVGLRRVTRPSSGIRLSRPRLVFARIPNELDELSSKVLLGGERIMGVAAQSEIALRVRAAMREGFQVM
jgi:hypothetical protein